jgi:hypothetical protein
MKNSWQKEASMRVFIKFRRSDESFDYEKDYKA